MKKTALVKAEEGWTKTFTGLPKYNRMETKLYIQ